MSCRSGVPKLRRFFCSIPERYGRFRSSRITTLELRDLNRSGLSYV